MNEFEVSQQHLSAGVQSLKEMGAKVIGIYVTDDYILEIHVCTGIKTIAERLGKKIAVADYYERWEKHSITHNSVEYFQLEEKDDNNK